MPVGPGRKGMMSMGSKDVRDKQRVKKAKGRRQKTKGKRQKAEGGGIVDLDKHLTKQGGIPKDRISRKKHVRGHKAACNRDR